MKTFFYVCTIFSLLTLGHASAQDSFHMNLGGASGVETINNSFVFSGNGVSATVKSWSISRTASGASMQRSEVVQWAPGIGSKNSSEAITSVPYVPYYVDNEDHYDLVLFVFDKNVDLSSVFLNPSGNTFDTDVTYWFGNVAQDVDLTGISSQERLEALGFGSAFNDDTSPSSSTRSVALTTPVDGVNALLVGARIGGDSDFDRFKIASVNGTTVVPEPSSFLLIGLAGMTMLMRRKR